MKTIRTALLASLLVSACSSEKTPPPPTGTPAATAAAQATATGKKTGENSPPTIGKVTVTAAGGTVDMLHPNRNDVLEARAETTDPEGDGVIVEWKWEVNGREIAGALGQQLLPQQGQYKKGDTVTAIASARDTRGAKQEAVGKGQVVIRNSPPTITSAPADLKNYRVVANDPDGDPLTFSLEKPVPGFALSADGVLTFDPKAGDAAKGQQLVIIGKDSENATSKQVITVNF